MESYFVTEESKQGLNRIFIHLTTIRAYIILEEFEKAKRLCRMLITLTRDFNRLLDNIEAQVLLSVVLWMTGEKNDAEKLLIHVLASIEPYGFVRVFADEGKAVLPILKRIIKKPKAGRGCREAEIHTGAFVQRV